MEYSKEFLSQFKVDATNYTYVPVDNLSLIHNSEPPHVVPLVRKGTTKKFEALVYAEESSLRAFQCAAIQCDLKLLQDCQGCRCLPGGRKDGKAVVFKIEYIYQVHEQ